MPMACDQLHFIRIIQPHTDVSLGDCNYLDTCNHMRTCKRIHYELDQSLDGPMGMHPGMMGGPMGMRPGMMGGPMGMHPGMIPPPRPVPGYLQVRGTLPPAPPMHASRLTNEGPRGRARRGNRGLRPLRGGLPPLRVFIRPP